MMRFSRTLVGVLTLLLVAAMVAPEAEAQPGGSRGGREGGGGRRSGFGGFGGGDILGRDDVRQELGITEDQIKQIEEARNAQREKMGEMFRNMRGMSSEERSAAFSKVREDMSKAVESQLNASQVKRMQELTLQTQGYRALRSDSVAKDLSMSDDQKERVQKALSEYDIARFELRRLRDLSDEDREKKQDALEADRDKIIKSVLSASQMQTFEGKKGAKFEFSEDGGSGRGPSGGSTPRGPATAGSTTTPGGGYALAPSATVGAETVDAQGDPVLSFGGEPGKAVEKLSFNFRFAPWTDVLKMFADAAGLTLDLNDVPPGSFNYYDKKEYTPIQALDVMAGYLLQKGYMIVKRDEFLVTLSMDRPGGIPPNLIPIINPADLPNRGRNEMLTMLMKVEGIEAADAVAEIDPLLGPWGKATSLSRTNRIHITDIGSNLRRIHDLLTSEIDTGDTVFKQIQLKEISVIDADAIIRELFGLPARGVGNVSAGSGNDPRYSSSRYSRPPTPPPAASAEGDGAVQVAVDERTNTLLITAKPSAIKIIDETIAAIDVPAGPGFNARSREPYLEVYQLKSGDTIEVTKTLNVLYPGAVVNEDGRARRIHIYGTKALHDEIEPVIKRLDGDGDGNTIVAAVIPLARMDAFTATASIQSLFLLDGDNAPIIQPNPNANGLIVRGTQQQVDQIKLLVSELEPVGGGPSGSGNVRTIALGGRDAEEMAELLKGMFERSSRNPIRIVVPSATGADRRVPSFRSRPLDPEPLDRQPAAGGEARRSPTDNVRPASNLREPQAGLDALRKNAGVFNVNFQQDAGDASDAGAKTDLEAVLGIGPAADNGPDGKSPILIRVQGGNLVVISQDEKALDEIEELVASLSQAIPPRNNWTVFYLQSSDATDTAAILERIFPTSSVSSASTAGSGGMFGDLTSGISSMGRNVMNMSGLDGLMNSATTLRIIPDTRSNSLFVTGPPHLVKECEEMLMILDASELPEQLRERAPRYIVVKHADIADVADIIEDVYKEELTPPQQRQQQRGGGGNPLAALMGGGTGGTAAKVKLTLGVDSRTSRLIVSASEPLFNQIRLMVEDLDEAALMARRTIRVVPLKNANTAILQQTLASLMPRVHVSRSSTSGRSTGGNNQGGDNGAADAQRKAQEEAFRQAIQQRFQQQGRGGQGGNPFQGRGGQGGGRPGGR
jgi:type II secretory pathway component GspD/PulD (secretin)/Spy/CpxP family protein refolding chaperone